MISPNDISILTALSMYPDMSLDEADTYIDRLEHHENIPVAQAVTGRISPDTLNAESRQTYDEFMRWHFNRVDSIRNEERSARYAQRETRRASKMLELKEKGIISEETLILYGISGPLPDRHVYIQMSENEKERLWSERMERRFGEDWRRRLNIRPNFLRRKCEKIAHNWLKEGF